MASLRHGIVTFPIEIKESQHKSGFYRLRLPFIQETLRKVLVGEIPRNEGLLEIENYLKSMSRLPVLSEGFMVHLENGDLYFVMNGVENVSSKTFRVLDRVLKRKGLIRGKEIVFDKFSFLPYEVNVGDETFKFIEILNNNIELETGLQIWYNKDKVRPLCDRVEFYEDRIVFFAEIEAGYKDEVENIMEFFMYIAHEFDIFVYVVPVIWDGIFRVRGVMESGFLDAKHRVKDLENALINKFDKEDIHGKVFLGSIPVVAGAFELERFRLPVVWGHVPEIDNEKVYLDKKLREETFSKGFIGFDEIPFIGRLEEIEEFISILEGIPREKLPYLINVSGVPGVGKTRFVEEVLRFAKGKFTDLEVIKIDFPYASVGNKYTTLSVVARALGVVGDNWDKISINELAERIRLKLKELSEKHLVIVVLDNADFIDEDTLTFAKEIITSKHSPRFFAVFISREKRVPLHLSHEKYRVITLHPMTRETLKFIVLELLGAFPSSDFIEFIYDNTQGIPLYVIELLSRLKREGQLTIHNGRVYMNKIPERMRSLEDILKDFYKNLSRSPAKVMLEILAVFSGSIPLHIMEFVFTKIKPNSDFEESVQALTSTNLVEFRNLDVISPGVTLAFKNNLFREIILRTMAPNWYSRIRNLIVEALRQDTRLPDIFKYRVIAEYLKDAGDIKGYTHYMFKAVREFIRVNAYDVARELMLKMKDYEEYIENKREFYETLTMVLIQTGNYGEAKKAYEKVLKLGGLDDSLKIPLGIIVYVGVGENKKAEDLLRRLDLRKVRKAEKGYVYNALGVYYYRLGKYEKALEYLIKARRFLENNKVMYIANLSNLASTYERMGRYLQALSIIDDGIRIARSIFHSQHLMGLYHNRAIIHIHLGEYESAISDLEESAFWAENMKLDRTMSYIYNTKGILHFEFGRYKDALKDLSKAYESVLKTEDKRQKSSILANLGYARTHLGDWSEAENNLYESKILREQLKDERGLSYTLFYLGELEKQKERYDKAQKYFQKSMKIKEKVDDRMGILYVMAQNAFLQIELGDYKTAYKIARKGIKLAEEASDTHALLLLLLSLLNAYIEFGEFKKVQTIMDKIKKELAHRNHHHIEGLAFYISGIWKLKQGAYTVAFSEFLNAREKFKFTGEKKALAKTVEKLLEIMTEHSVYYMNTDMLVRDARDALKFYERYALSSRAKKLSLMLSKL